MQKRVLFLALAALLLCGAVYGENRTALVIGNGAYRHFQSLPRPRPEAIEMSNTLKALGFEVITVLDGSYDQMLDAVMSFERKLNQRKGIALFHYGGHGMQVGGENYLLPVDREIPDEMRVRSRALNVSEIVSAMRSSGAGSNIIILDACRDNPLPAATRSTSSRGLARLDAPVNSIVVYSADAGKTAQDGVFTPTLIEQMKIPGLTITEVMMRVRQEVYRKTGGSQMPGEYSQLFEQIYLAGRPVVVGTSEMQVETAALSRLTEAGYIIGSRGPAGGIVFFDKGHSSDGWRYLEVWIEDEVDTYRWKTSTTSTRGTSAAIGTGYANTYKALEGSSHPAAEAARNASHGGYTDWFLPSKNELHLLSQQSNVIEALGSAYLWSSSENSDTFAWIQHSRHGTQTNGSKTSRARVRVIRAF
jgi:hypothetical protein